MQVALPLGQTIEKQTVGLAALVLAGMALTPMDWSAIQDYSQYSPPKVTLTVVKGVELSEQASSQPKAAPSTFRELESGQKYRISMSALLPPTEIQVANEEKQASVAAAGTFSTSDVATEIKKANQQATVSVKVNQSTAPADSEQASATNMELRGRLVEDALTWQGTLYLYGGQSRAGIDCSALVQIVYQKYGVALPRTSRDQYREGRGVAQANLLPGDLVFFSTNGPGASHVGIYLGDNKFLSATKRQVEIQSLEDQYWKNTYRGSRRVLS